MTRVETLHRTIRHVYEAALVPANWSPALAEVAGSLGAQHASLIVQVDGAPSLTVFTGLEPKHARHLQHEFETRLPGWIKAIPAGTLRRQTTEISEADFQRTDIYNQVVRPAGMFYGVVAPLVCLPDQQIHFSAGRDLGLTDFSDDDVDTASLIIPHLTTAVQARNRLAAAELRAKGAYEVIARLDFGVILLDARMRPIFVNPRAEVLGRAGDGLSLKRNEVSAMLQSEAKGLRDAISMAIGMNAAGRDASEAAMARQASMRCYLSRRPPRRPLVVRVLPVDATDFPDGISVATRAILFVMEPDGPSGIDQMALATTFHLTRREAVLATLLARGMDLAEAATQQGIGLGTARGYLKQILAKTDTHRQAELVSLLLRSGIQIVS
ncbi:helix-turn-helix transcriptional regulator [Paraburkholderia sp. BL17N1]|uniref:helix-turn-helix transcriptional regulator n=1 Tax=Paraburkholderia sp. BL17N1 TaxID=1938798 RepID=UPI000EB0C629|nr:helix-turn-helix transcriptional regulator [Paraburkholderia sp. BL17N1]RKR31219.1 DNA-binding CsgD family transcriptional regulator [Paraburkholderia sp. BL17N1]